MKQTRKISVGVTVALLIALVFTGEQASILNGSRAFAAEEQGTAQIIESDYPRDEILVADIICSPEYGYATDATGKVPSTLAIQNAVNDCYAMGGGTVYLPAGNYLVDARIDLKSYVSLVGDYIDPDEAEGDYGTVIVAGVASTSDDVGESYNLFRMQGSSALIELTFFYPNQYMDFVMPYAYAIEIPGGITNSMHTTFTIKNITFLNAYKGICASITPHSTLKSVTHEQLYLENVKGTILREGMHLTNSSEVGNFCGITLSPSYWAEAGEEFNAPDVRNIVDYTSEYGVGMILGDLEWQQIRDVTLEDYHTGIYFTEGDRNTDYSMSFIGSFYRLSVTGSFCAVYIEQMYANMGIQFAKSVLEGQYALVNASPASDGHVQLSGVDCKGELRGSNLYYNDQLCDEAPEIEEAELSYELPVAELFDAVRDYGTDNTGSTDASAAVQGALDAARANGGGVVYLPAGVYRLESPLTVYAGTQLRGAGSGVQRDNIDECGGTLLLAYYGKSDTPETSEALITLSGDNSGVSCLRVVYPELNLFEKGYDSETLPEYAFTLRGEGKGNYADKLYLEGVCNGIDFSSCDNALISRVMGSYYRIGFKVGGKDAVIDNCLHNGICILKVTLPSNSELYAWGTYSKRSELLATNVYQLTRYSTHFIVLENAENAKINHVFSFAANTFLTATNSTFTGANLGMDSQPSDSGAMFELTNSEGLCYNTLRDACSMVGNYYSDSESTLTVYNRITLLPGFGMNNEGNLIADTVMSAGAIHNEAAEIGQIWKQETDYVFVDYSDGETEDPGNAGERDGNAVIILCVCAGVVVIAAGVAAVILWRKKEKREK